MAEYARGNHAVHEIKYHIVWIMKYQYEILTKRIAEWLRELLIPGCESRGIRIVECRERTCTYADNVSDAYSSGEDSPISERENIEVNPGRISGIKGTILGATFVGERIFLCEGRDSDARDDTGIYRTSAWEQETLQGRRGKN